MVCFDSLTWKLASHHKSMEKRSVSPLSYLFTHLDLSRDFLWLSLLWSSLLFSDSSRLCFSFVHIVGSLTSKVPSKSRRAREREREIERERDRERERDIKKSNHWVMPLPVASFYSSLYFASQNAFPGTDQKGIHIPPTPKCHLVYAAQSAQKIAPVHRIPWRLMTLACSAPRLPHIIHFVHQKKVIA